MDACLPDSELDALARGELSADAEALARKHVDRCATCYAQLLRRHRRDIGEKPLLDWGHNTAPDIAWLPGTDLGRYVILHTLGKGGMGVVFRAYDKELDRAVALKVLHHDDSDGRTPAPTRLLREAQAMARLSHPNVVAVHDVIVLENRICAVMELVEGVTVADWLKRSPKRSWKEIVDVFRAAGEGLAAAHDANLVHRDFKPENVLVGQDGRIRVTDFGIARFAGDGAGAALARELPGAAAATEHARGTHSLTVHGVGTPRYMAPEQFKSAPANFRTDQFSFAVALYEALYGQSPFAGSTLPARVKAAERGELQAPPSSSNVPPWIFQILVQALSPDPTRRFGSMRELTHALSVDPSQRRNRLLGGAALALAAVLTVVMVADRVQTRARLCTGSELKLQGVWDAERREKVRAAFAATGVPFAEDSFSRAAEVLDAYTTEWVATRREACEATSIRGEQSDQVLTLRMACLQQRLDAVNATTDLFTHVDAQIVGTAKQALDALPRLATCSDVASLTAKVPPPEDAKVAAEVERIGKELARVKVLAEAGRPEDAEAIATAAFAAAERTGYSPIHAEAELHLGLVYGATNRIPKAVELYTDAFARGLADGDDEVVALAALRLAQSGFRLRQDERALEWTAFAEAANQRVRDPEWAVRIHNSRGNLARNGGDFARAASYYLKGSEEARARLGPEHMTTLGVSYNYASALQNLGRFREARARLAAIIDTARRTLGPKHPFLAYPLIGSAEVAAFTGHYDEAKAFYQEVLAITRGHGRNADAAFDGLADLARREHRYDDALEYVNRALAIREDLAPEGPERLHTLAIRGLVLLDQGNEADAVSVFDDVLARGAKLEGAFDAIADARVGKARILTSRGDHAAALPLAKAAVDALVPTRGKSHPSTLEARLVVAEILWANGQRAEAVRSAEEILADARVELGDNHALPTRARALIAQGKGDRLLSGDEK